MLGNQYGRQSTWMLSIQDKEVDVVNGSHRKWMLLLKTEEVDA